MPTSHWIKKSSSYLSGIFSIAASLPFCFSPQTTQAQNTALAQTPPTSPSASATAPEAKGGLTVVDTPFGKLSFAEIRKHEKRDEILEKLKPSQQARYHEWEEKMANQAAEQSAIRKQVAIEDILSKLPRVIPLYEAGIASWKKLSLKHKQLLEYALSLKRPPDWMPRIEKLLANPQNFADSAPR
jgi:hypothetical protein